ncbi:MAG: alpha-amylase [Candidatus Nanopelagicales bacterium]
MSGVMLQYFHWYLPNDGTLWNDLAVRSAELAQAGFSSVWLPPSSKGHVGGYDVGYGVYDMYDLGEFDQKGSVRTKYGTRSEYFAAIGAAQAAGLAVFADIVWNHRLGADQAETVWATPYSTHDRRHPAGEAREVRVWTRFDFAARAGRYDEHTLDARHFTAVDYDEWSHGEYDTIYLFAGKHFDQAVSSDYGNYAYLMGCDLDHSNPEVQRLLTDWGKWLLDVTGIDGLRLDAVKHLPEWALAAYVAALRAHSGRELPVVGEYWSEDLGALHSFLAGTGESMMLFDVPLHYNFFRASHAGNSYDLRRIFDNSLLASRPDAAVTFVDNHDSQPLQALESPVMQWFKPLAYALILLRSAGYPCVFHADYFGARYTDQRWGQPAVEIELPELRQFIDTCLLLRLALGDDATEEDTFDHPNVVGWVRTAEKLIVVVLLSTGDAGSKYFDVHAPGATFREATGATADHITTDEHGTAEFGCPAGGVAVWVALL